MLTRNHRQEALSRAYVQAVAALCGMTWSSRETDYGIDMALHEIEADGPRLSESGFGVDLQLKSTSAPVWSSDRLLFDLPVANYNDLRKAGRKQRVILVVLVLPEEESDWATLTDSELVLRRAAYWHSLTNAPQRGTASRSACRFRGNSCSAQLL